VIIVNLMLKQTQGYADAPFIFIFAQNNCNMYRNWFKAYVIDVLPSLSILLYVVAIINNVSFYSEFGIRIWEYVSFTEFLSDVLVQIVGVSFVVALFLNIVYIFYLNYDKYNNFHRSFYSKFIKFLKKLKKYHPKFYAIINKISKTNRKKDKIKGRSLVSIFGVYSCLSIYLFYKEPIRNDITYWVHIQQIVCAIILPFIFCCYALFFVQLFSRHILTIKQLVKFLRRIHVYEYILSFIIFFMYICSINYIQSKRDAQYLINTPRQFEVKEVDGTIYNNQDYIFIKNQYSKVFIKEKNRSAYYVLNMDNISYLKFQ